MRITYDGEGDTLSIVIADEQIQRSEEHGALILNYSSENRLVEVLNASELLGHLMTALAKARVEAP